MTIHSGGWWPVLASSELGKKPVGRTRFGERLVFWRSADGVVCMPDRCPHRGAALSLGRVNKTRDAVVCPFHGLEFAAHGSCTRIPVEQDYQIPEDFGVTPMPATEADGYVWVWRGAQPEAGLPAVATHPETAGLRYGAATGVWNAHFTRCIENVLDFSHLPFVHKTTIGLFKSDWVTTNTVTNVPGGFQAQLFEADKLKMSFEYLYPNRWLLRLSPHIMLGLVFAPIDDTHTYVYGRTYYRFPVPGLDWLMNAYTRFSQFMVFREDWPIVASQTPGDVLEATDEKLLPSDAPVIAYRKLLRSKRSDPAVSE